MRVVNHVQLKQAIIAPFRHHISTQVERHGGSPCTTINPLEAYRSAKIGMLRRYSKNPHKKLVFIRALRLKFNLLKPIVRNPQEAEIWNGSYILYILIYIYTYVRKKVFRVVFLHPIHTGKLNQLHQSKSGMLHSNWTI